MRNSFTIESILSSKAGILNLHLKQVPKSKKKVIKPRNDCKEVQWIHWNLKIVCEENGLLLVPELVFARPRLYRLDFSVLKGITIEEARKGKFIKANMIMAVEYQGGVFMAKSGHSNVKGSTRDCDKSNLAQSLGWPYYTYNALNYLNVTQDLMKIIKSI